MLQKQFTSSVSSCVVGYDQNCSSIFVVIIAWLGDCEIEREYSETGDFILDLYWSGCRGDWPSANT